MLFQNDIEILQSEITSLERIIATRRARIEQLTNAETVADSAIQSLQDAVAKFQELAPDAIAALKNAVLGLFGTDDSSSGSESEPEPAPGAQGGEADSNPTETTSGNEETFGAVAFETREFNPTPATSSNEETVPPGSLIQIENPHTGEKVSWVTPAVTDEPGDRPYVQFVPLNETVAYQRKRDGEVICAYIGCATSQLAKRWSEALELWGAATEIRKGKRIEGARWEIKFKNIDISRLNKIAESHPSFSSGVPSPKPESAEFPPDTPSDSSKNSTECADTMNPSASELPEFTFTEAPGSCHLTPDFMVYAPDGEYLGKVRESLTLKGWLHKHTDHKKPFPTREAAAADLYRRKITQQQIHDTANAKILAAHGF